jgi:methionyl-tRNA synthetase
MHIYNAGRSFLADRFVEGTCPHCGAIVWSTPSDLFYALDPHDRFCQDARGDQCDACARTLDGRDLLNPRCLLQPTTHHIVAQPSTHAYLRLDVLQQDVQEWILRLWAKGVCYGVFLFLLKTITGMLMT